MKKIYLSSLLAVSLLANEANSIYELNEVVVTASRYDSKHSETTEYIQVINKEEIQRINPLSTGELLWHITGASVSTGTGSGLPERSVVSLNGLPANYTLVLLDGVPLLSDHIHTGQNLDLIPTSSIERIEVMRGAASAQYGSDAIGGVVNIITRKYTNKDTAEIEASYGRYNTSEASIGALSSISEKLKFSGFLNWKKSDGFPIIAPAHRIDSMGNEKIGLLFRLDYYINDDIKAFTWMNIVKNTMDWRNNTTMDSLLVTKVAGLTKDIGSKASVTAQISHSDWSADVSNDRNKLLKTELYSLWEPSNKHTITTGVDFKENSFSRDAVDNAPNQYSTGVFIQDLWRVSENFSITPALRYDHVEDIGNALSPKLSALYNFTKDINLRGSVARGFRAPTLQELYEKGYGHGGTAYRFGNQNLNPEYSTTYSLGLETSPTDNLLVSVNTFYNDMKDMIVPIYKGAWTVDPTVDVWERTNISNAEVYGLELNTKYKVNENTKIELGYTYTDNKNKDTGRQLPYSPGESVFGKIENTLKLGSVTMKSYVGVQGAYNRKAWNWKPASGASPSDENGLITALDNYTKVDVGVSLNVKKDYDFFIKINNIFSEDIENLDDAYTVVDGEPFIRVGLKIALYSK